ncbi:MAG TPA: hypothetical protein VM581_01790 [Magnetospirillaceae bacterium]|nr:hypothetical protein [Magnetospirillaceae bacterium]
MTNTINQPNTDPGMWQYPTSSDTVAADTAELQQHLYTDYITADRESLAVEGGNPLIPVREGAVNIVESELPQQQVEYAIGRDVVVPQTAETVIATANQHVNAAYEAMPEAQAARMRHEHHVAASSQAGVYAPYIEEMRDHVLNQDDFRLAA